MSCSFPQVASHWKCFVKMGVGALFQHKGSFACDAPCHPPTLHGARKSPLSTGESDLRHLLKRKVIAVSVVERARKKQCTRITNLKEEDANTRFFTWGWMLEEGKNHIYGITMDGWMQLIMEYWLSNNLGWHYRARSSFRLDQVLAVKQSLKRPQFCKPLFLK
jgi:hypothetical protein